MFLVWRTVSFTCFVWRLRRDAQESMSMEDSSEEVRTLITKSSFREMRSGLDKEMERNIQSLTILARSSLWRTVLSGHSCTLWGSGFLLVVWTLVVTFFMNKILKISWTNYYTTWYKWLNSFQINFSFMICWLFKTVKAIKAENVITQDQTLWQFYFSQIIHPKIKDRNSLPSVW